MSKNNFILMWITLAFCTIKGGCKTFSKPVYANDGYSVILKCLNNSVATSWDGPSFLQLSVFNETPYAVNDQIVQQLPNAKNLMVVGDISVGEYNLKIINLTHNEEGYYKCNAHRGNQIFELQYFLKIKEPPKNLTTNGINGTLVGKAGEEMFIKCNVWRGVPENETKISLYYNDEIAKESLTGMLIYSFVPKGVNNGDTLKCVVRNLLLDAPLEEPIRLNITDRPLVRFDIDKHNITIFEGSSFSITCYSDSNPVATEILWKTNGEFIEDIKDIQHPKSIQLNIATIKAHHEGNYTCISKNQNGYGKKSIHITVVCCEVQNERNNTAVVVSISVVASAFLGVILFMTKGKLINRRRHASVRNNDLDQDVREETVVQIQIKNHTRDCTADEGTNAQVHIRDNKVLNYVEIDFTPQFVVHGKENMTIYSDVVLPIASTSAL